MPRRTTTTRRTPNSLGTVEQLPSGRFRASYRHDGAKFSAPVTFATRTEATGWLAGERADRLRGTWRDPRVSSLTLGEFATGWLAARVDLAPGTRALYHQTLTTWLLPRVGTPTAGVELGSYALDQLTPAVVRRWFAALTEATRAARLDQLAASPARVGHPARLWALGAGLSVKPTGRLSPAVLDAWRAAGSPAPQVTEHGAEPGRTAAAQAYRLLHAVCATAVADGLLTVNPCQIKGAGQVRAAERTTATPAEVQALAEAMPAHLRAAVVLAAWSGLRRGELFGLARRHVDLDAGSVRVERAASRQPGQRFAPTKTAGSVRTVYLPGFVVDVLRDHLAAHVGASPDALLFGSVNNNPVAAGTVDKHYRRARALIGRPELHWHDLRHTGATLAYQAGANVRDVQRRLGHTTTRAAMIYAHTADDSDKLLAARLDAMHAPGNVVPLHGQRSA